MARGIAEGEKPDQLRRITPAMLGKLLDSALWPSYGLSNPLSVWPTACVYRIWWRNLSIETACCLVTRPWSSRGSLGSCAVSVGRLQLYSVGARAIWHAAQNFAKKVHIHVPNGAVPKTGRAPELHCGVHPQRFPLKAPNMTC